MGEIAIMKTPKVTVLMSTFNGEKYLKEQIDGIENQSGVEVVLKIRDDGSTDGTTEIIQGLMERYGNIELTQGENVGYANSFMSLMLEDDDSDYYAFADQDDVWDPLKIQRAITVLAERDYYLYASSLTIVDENDEVVGEKKFENFRSTVGSILSRNRLAGCTMVFGKALYEDFRSQLGNVIKSNSFGFGHDGWLMLYSLLNRGEIIVDDESHIHYRRHSSTITSSHGGLKKRIQNELRIFNNKENRRVRIAQILLDHYKESYSEECLRVLKEIAGYKKNFRYRMKLLFGKDVKCGIPVVDFKNSLAIIFRKY